MCMLIKEIIYRGKRRYAKQDLIQLLETEGVKVDKLIPKPMKIGEKIILNEEPDPAPFPFFIPLEIFDNSEYDPRTPEEWLSCGIEDGIQKPVPGKALLPEDDLLYQGLKLNQSLIKIKVLFHNQKF